MLASTSIGFDLSVFELFAPLSCGGQVILADDALALPGLPAASAVTLINTVPSALTELLRLGRLPPSIRVVGLGGEALPHPLARRIYQEESVRAVYDLYGPTETTVYSTAALVTTGAGASHHRPADRQHAGVRARRPRIAHADRRAGGAIHWRRRPGAGLPGSR